MSHFSIDKVIPLDTVIIVRVEKLEEKTEGGIILPDDVRDKGQMLITEGILVKIGDMAWDELKQLGKIIPKIGDIVYFKRHSGILHVDKKTENEVEYRVMHDQDLYLDQEDDSGGE